VHGRSDTLEHLKELAAETRSLLGKADGERSHAERRRLKDLLAYLDAEHDYHAGLFPDKVSRWKPAIKNGGEGRAKSICFGFIFVFAVPPCHQTHRAGCTFADVTDFGGFRIRLLRTMQQQQTEEGEKEVFHDFLMC
jgi:hypothetical protein